MTARFGSIKKVSIPKAVADKILHSIQQGRFGVGDRLPPERKLCEELNVSRTSLREGISILIHLGILNSVPGSGIYVRSGHPAAVLKEKLKSLGMDKQNADDLIEFREKLEPIIAEMAIKNADKEDIDKLEKIVIQMEKLGEANKSFSQEDVNFHKNLARATHNEFFAIVFEAIVPFILRWVQAREPIIEKKKVISMHRQVLEEIKKGKKGDVRKALKDHFQHTRLILISAGVEENKEREKDRD
jgi:DNA-binding FadR family transcriptional regulator